MNQKTVLSAWCCLSLLILSPSASAGTAGQITADQTTLFQQGKTAFLGKDYQTAVKYLQEALVNDPANLDISFYLGLSAFELGDYETAVMSFERILIMKPEAMRVKLELARAHMRLGAYELAKQYFYEVLAANPPQTVRTKIESLLSAIAAAERRHFFSGTIAAGLSYDDNTRSAPGDFQLVFPGALGNLTLDVSAPPQSDYYTTASAVLNHIYRAEGSPFSWKTTVTSFNNLYGQYYDMNVNLLGLSTGPALETSRGLFELHGIYNEVQVEHEMYMKPFGIGGSAIVTFGPKVIANLSATLQKKEYSADSNSVKDATNLTLGVSPIIMFGDNRITLNLQNEAENADADYWSYDRLAWGLRYGRQLPADFTAFAGINQQQTDYDAIKPGEVDTRSDTLTDLYCGLTKLLWQSKNKSQNLSAQLTYTYTDSDSNISTYDYRKNLTAGLLSYGF